MKNERLQKVVANMEKMGLKQLVVSSPSSIAYLTGKKIAPGERMLALLINDAGDMTLFANQLFALTSFEGAELIEYADTDDCVGVLASRIQAGRLGVDKDWPCRFALPLIERRSDVCVSLGSRAVDDARMCKTPEEIDLMRASSHLNDQIIQRAMAKIGAGVTEKDIADAYAQAAVEMGASGESFPSLICFGANCAEPHHDTDRTAIKAGDSVILDVGCLLNGYCADMTRTVFYGEPSEEAKKVYALVEAANRAGREAVRPGVPLKDVDRAARKVIEDTGYGKYFIHRTGHGIGLDVHEFPDVSATSEAICQPGMTFSVEPGVYLPGRFGVRVEDLVAVTEDGCETLNELNKDLKILPC